MKIALLAFCAYAAPLQHNLKHDLLTQDQAAQVASDFANLKLKEEGFESTKAGWQGKFRHGRWHMQCLPPLITVGWTVAVSFKADGSDKRLEGSSFSPE